MIQLTTDEVRDALAEVGITGPVAGRLTEELNKKIEEKLHDVLMEHDPLNALFREHGFSTST